MKCQWHSSNSTR